MTMEKRILNRIDTKQEYLNRVRDGFYAVMNAPGGYGVNFIDRSMRPSGKTGTSQSFIDTDNDGRIDTETITNSFIGYFPSDNPKITLTVTSPDIAHPNSNIDFMSMTTFRITKNISNRYREMYGIS